MIRLALSTFLVAGALGACHLALDLDSRALAPEGGVGGLGGSSAASGGGGGEGGQGGVGGEPECLDHSDCPAPPDEICQVSRCDFDSGECVNEPIDDPALAQVDGDCQVLSCEDGVLTSTADDTDVPNDNLECTTDECIDGVPAHTPLTGETCGINGIGTCDDAGNCVGCVTPADCGADTFCLVWACNASVCEQTFPNDGVALPAEFQTSQDCKEVRCVMGTPQEQADSTDPASDNIECTTDQCNGTTPTHPAAPAGTPCSAGVCDGANSCVECVTSNHCSGGQQCNPATNQCLKGLGEGCGGDGECSSGECVDGVCCENACNGVCRGCALENQRGKCLPYPGGTDPDGDCAPKLCDGMGACVQ